MMHGIMWFINILEIFVKVKQGLNHLFHFTVYYGDIQEAIYIGIL